MSLTDAACRHAKSKDKAYKLSDGAGLYLLVHPNGGRYWRWKYRWMGKEKLLAFGTYPRVPLTKARDDRNDARKKLEAGLDPSAIKRQEKHAAFERSVNNFEVLAREWLAARTADWTPKHAATILSSLEADVFPFIGERPVAELTAPEILAVLRRVEGRNALDIAGRVMQRIGAVIRFAIATGRAERNPVTELRGALKSPERTNMRALPAEDLPDFLRALATYKGSEVTRLGMRLLIMTFVRSNELRGATWAEFDLDAALWRIPGARMKMGLEQLVPLSTQAVASVRRLQELNGQRKHVFPNIATPSKVMSENTFLRCIELLGYREKATAHGFRTTASTWLNEHGFMPDVIERQLAHSPRDKVRGAYNKAQWLPERIRMMQTWSDVLDAMEAGKKVIPSRFGRTNVA